MIKAIIFDMAGTTVQDNHEVETCFSQACNESGLITTQERILAIQGWSKKYVFEVLWTEQLGEGHPEISNNAARSFETFRNILENYYHTHPLVPTHGTAEVFAYCKLHGIKIVLTTGFYRKVTNLILEKLGWNLHLNEQYLSTSPQSVIDLSIASDEVENGRPWPDMVYKAMQILDIHDPKEIVVIGDTPSDLGIGKNAQALLTIGLTNGTHTREQLENYPHDLLLDQINELIPILNDFQNN